MRNCPFYGRFMYRNNSLIVDPPFILLDSTGNQCGLITTKHAPCLMEMTQCTVEWSECPIVKDARIDVEVNSK